MATTLNDAVCQYTTLIPDPITNRAVRVLVERLDSNGAGSVSFQSPRVGSFNLSSTDNGTVIPCGAALTATLLSAAALDVNFVCELRATVAAPITVAAGAGATLLVGGASVGSINITGEGSSICIVGSGTAGKFYASKIGA